MLQKPSRFAAGVFCFGTLLIFLTGCATGPLAGLPKPTLDRSSTADDIAYSAGMQKSSSSGKPFTIRSYYRLEQPGGPLHVYIEGDGLAWVNKLIVSDDPTPMNPIALRLAALDPAPNVVYLARPCQYVGGRACDYTYWAGHRFAPEVIDSMNEAVEDYVRRSGSSQVHLVGYSGGAAVAVLLADRRSDVASLRTVAGNLDPNGLNRHHHVSALSGSLDPIEAAFRISRVPQRHFVGRLDQRVPRFVAENFVKASEVDDCIQITDLSATDHAKGWEARWKELLNQPLSCRESE